MILGDSLSAGYQMPLEEAWPSLITKKLSTVDHPISVINASISGDTSGNGLARLPNLLAKHNPEFVLIELGANDGLRGFKPSIIADNLTEMILLIRQAGAVPILMQIHTLPNYGRRYTESFSALYPNLAKQLNVPLIPFLLREVITKPEWMMSDGLHPKSVAQPWIAEFVAQHLIKVLHKT